MHRSVIGRKFVLVAVKMVQKTVYLCHLFCRLRQINLVLLSTSEGLVHFLDFRDACSDVRFPDSEHL